MSEARATTELRERLKSLDHEVERMEREGWFGKKRQEAALCRDNRASDDVTPNMSERDETDG